MIICVTGSSSNVGKTTFIERLLEHLEGAWGVCKVTVCSPGGKHRCPRGKDDTCGVCSEDLDSYITETNRKVLRQEGKDTGRYYDAGAREVIWVRTRPEFLKEGVTAAVEMLKSTKGIIFEGNHALAVLDPDLAVMALGNPVRYKASARAVLDRIDVSGGASDPKLLAAVLDRIRGKGVPRL